jgi:hypothetical protein
MRTKVIKETTAQRRYYRSCGDVELTSTKEKLERLLEKGSGPYLVVFREEDRKKPDYEKIYLMDDLRRYVEDYSYLFSLHYEMIVYEVKLRPIFRVESVSEKKANEAWLLISYEMAGDGFVMKRKRIDGALVISMDWDAPEEGRAL